MTPNQYKENVKINIIYHDGNDEIDAFNLKYNVSETGKSFKNEALRDVMYLSLKPASKEDFVSGDYLIETDNTLFTSSIIDEKPLKVVKTDYKSLLDDLESIINDSKEEKKTNKNAIIEKRVDDNIIKETNGSIVIKKVKTKLDE